MKPQTAKGVVMHESFCRSVYTQYDIEKCGIINDDVLIDGCVLILAAIRMSLHYFGKETCKGEINCTKTLPIIKHIQLCKDAPFSHDRIMCIHL